MTSVSLQMPPVFSICYSSSSLLYQETARYCNHAKTKIITKKIKGGLESSKIVEETILPQPKIFIQVHANYQGIIIADIVPYGTIATAVNS